MGASVLPATAADLGGNCCADLEERIAELEATTARKGNRKVSLTISGWVSEQIAWWDDGTEQNVYIGTNPVEQSRFRFIGEAKIDKDWSAGYVLEIGVNGAPGGQWDQNNLNGSGANSLNVRKSSWFIKSARFGKVLVGQDGTSTYHLLDDADTTMTRNFYDAEGPPDYQAKFFVRDRNGAFISSGGGNLRWSDVTRGFNNSTPGDNGRRNIVRYDTPTVAGFSATTSWGEDDIWDAALIYKGEIGDFTVNARAGYGHSTDGRSTACHTVPSVGENGDCEWWGVSGFVQHKPTGLFAYAGYGEQNDNSRAEFAINPELVDKTDTTWFVQAGIEQKWFSLGKTNFFGHYRRDDAGSNLNASGALRTQSGTVEWWALGAAQYLDAAETMLYLVYQHTDGEALIGTDTTSTSLAAFDQVIGGVKVNF
ncbi:porin [Hyphomicrobium methylovorum]|uniref:porin n=1 Tax=Hyphomicrobium methylovorum TaxID=84 RepID=UPI001FED1D1A|nr:porin [Hyphomicrobium methylovorum]